MDCERQVGGVEMEFYIFFFHQQKELETSQIWDFIIQLRDHWLQLVSCFCIVLLISFVNLNATPIIINKLIPFHTKTFFLQFIKNNIFLLIYLFYITISVKKAWSKPNTNNGITANPIQDGLLMTTAAWWITPFFCTSFR